MGVRHSSVHRAAPAAMMAKGFGKVPDKPPPKPASEGKKKRDAAAAKLDKLTATGNPEYMVSIRTVGSETSEWMPVGGLAVPRSNSVDTAVSMAIFNNEDELLKGAFRAFPKLKTSKDKFEYGYRLRDFPEDEIKGATKDAKPETKPFDPNLASLLMSPQMSSKATNLMAGETERPPPATPAASSIAKALRSDLAFRKEVPMKRL